MPESTPNTDREKQLDIAEDHFELKRRFFDSGETLSYAFRKMQLKRLRKAIEKNEELIFKALHKDLKKSTTESYMTEVGVVLSEIDYTLKHLKGWMRPNRALTPLFIEPSSSKIYSSPKGVVLIIAPWNYPFYLTIAPLIGAIAAGNCAVIKPSEDTPHTAQLIENIIHTYFGKNLVSVVQGEGHIVVPGLMKRHTFNHVFFTGSTQVGKSIARQAAEKLTPTTLELGGKSPAIVHSSADLKVAAKRIAWGKFVNAGQTCVAPDYLMVEQKILDSFLSELKKTITKFYGSDPQLSPDYPRLIHTKRFDTVVTYLSEGNVIFGGRSNREDLYIEPTLLLDPDPESPVMNEEIFGPVLPILPFEKLEEIKTQIQRNPYPLSAYLFGSDTAFIDHFKHRFQFGGGCINDTLVHLANPGLPFGGIMTSGTGNYHGRHSFDCFSHSKGMVHSRTWLDPALRYPPYSDSKFKWLKRLV